jgi:hypothetical protein
MTDMILPHSINPYMSLGCKFHLLSGMEGFLIYGTLKHIHNHMAHQHQQQVRTEGPYSVLPLVLKG